ncbi:SPP1 phage holin family protein [Amphibacillus cookii]|uniref:SPP1 phage holin family protein n=1 Tax=Amphibacillus cookii TaxID=767787 RepID=UPI00195E56FA|nr:SPP1 phage holin family protein [Amphibacillus cookii]MBM7542350.1 SPP1 family holin [Amphibacillus cookii]
MLNIKGVNKQTWGRMIALFLMLLNQLGLSFFDFKLLPFTDDDIYQGVSVLISIIVTVWASWKNNSFTLEAQHADQHLKGGKQDGKNIS